MSVITDQKRNSSENLTQQSEVLFLEDIAPMLRMSVRTIKRRLRVHGFPIPQMPRLDRRHRWSRSVVESWIANASQFDGLSLMPKRTRVARRMVG